MKVGAAAPQQWKRSCCLGSGTDASATASALGRLLASTSPLSIASHARSLRLLLLSDTWRLSAASLCT
eukprot:1666177-Alexandrium_andersonii.AAC.1